MAQLVEHIFEELDNGVDALVVVLAGGGIVAKFVDSGKEDGKGNARCCWREAVLRVS